MLRIILCSSVLALSAAHAATPKPTSPYVGQETRDIKALSAQDVADTLAGKGMGFAKAAELNGYPGPTHVLALAAQLELTAEQKAGTEALFRDMQARAVALGKQLVAEERVLDRLFAARTVTADGLERALARIAKLRGQLRQAHLAAHLVQTDLLRPAQVEQYNALRGYTKGAGQGAGQHGAHRNH